METRVIQIGAARVALLRAHHPDRRQYGVIARFAQSCTLAAFQSLFDYAGMGASRW